MIGIHPADLLQKPLVNINDKTDGLIILYTDVTSFEVDVGRSNLLLSRNVDQLPKILEEMYFGCVLLSVLVSLGIQGNAFVAANV